MPKYLAQHQEYHFVHRDAVLLGEPDGLFALQKILRLTHFFVYIKSELVGTHLIVSAVVSIRDTVVN